MSEENIDQSQPIRRVEIAPGIYEWHIPNPIDFTQEMIDQLVEKLNLDEEGRQYIQGLYNQREEQKRAYEKSQQPWWKRS